MPQPAVEELREWERIAAHSHIHGLGLEGLRARPVADGLVGQQEAREAAGIVVRLVKEGKFAGRGVLIAGPVGSGKTAIAIAIAKELGRDVPFVHIAASEIFSAEIKKTEFLTQALRKAIGVRIREKRKVYEGVVKDITIEKEAHPYNPYMKVPVSATIRLETKDDSKRLSMDQNFAMQLIQQGVDAGDVIQIDVDGGRLVKLGPCKEEVEKKKAYDISAYEFVEKPSGEVLKEKEFVYVLSLHQLDAASSRRGLVFDFFFGFSERKEIDADVRKRVDEQVKEMVEAGKAEIIPGVLFIDECSLLDIETFAFLNRAMEQELCPIVVLATNRGVARIRGTDQVSPHAVPIDLLDRLLIITTKLYSKEEVRKIVELRAKFEKFEVAEDALVLLTEIGASTSLRYAIQLLAPANELAKEEGKKRIERQHVERARQLFVDVKKSSEYLTKYEKEFLTY